MSPLWWASDCCFLGLLGTRTTSYLSRFLLGAYCDCLLSYSEISHTRSGNLKEGKKNKVFLWFNIFLSKSLFLFLLSHCHIYLLEDSFWSIKSYHSYLHIISWVIWPESTPGNYHYEPKLLISFSYLFISVIHAHWQINFSRILFKD